MHILVEKMSRVNPASKKAPVPPAKRIMEVAQQQHSRVTSRKPLKRLEEAEWQPHVAARHQQQLLEQAQTVPANKTVAAKRKKVTKISADRPDDGEQKDAVVAVKATIKRGGSAKIVLCPRCRLDIKDWGFCGVTGEPHEAGNVVEPPPR